MTQSDIDPGRVTHVTTIGDILVETAAQSPDVPALVVDGERRTYGELLTGSTTLGRALVALGVEPGDRVGVLMPNSVRFAEALFGTMLVGGVVVPVNARFQGAELAHVLADAGVRVLVTTAAVDDHVDFVARIEHALPGWASATGPSLSIEEAPELRAVVVTGTSSPPRAAISDDTLASLAATVPSAEVWARRVAVAVRSVAMQPYTSGTTAHPKGCLLTHEALVRDWRAVGDRFGLRRGARIWNPLPMFHMSGLGVLLAACRVGATVYTDAHFSADDVLRRVQQERLTHLYPSFPLITMDLIRHPDFATIDVSSVEAILSVAPPDTMAVMQDAFPGAVQFNCYGMTETAGITTFTERDDPPEVRHHTSGLALEGVTVRVVDPSSGVACGADEDGEIQVSGWNLMEGYHGREQPWTDDGWLRTGDHGALDADGRLRYLGRLKDMLKVGGENVAPSEIESHLSTHPAVKVVQVVGAPDQRYDEVPAAFVELVDGETTTAEELIAFCRGEMANFKVPRHVRFVTEWPMSATKVQKHVLRARITEELRQGTAVH